MARERTRPWQRPALRANRSPSSAQLDAIPTASRRSIISVANGLTIDFIKQSSQRPTGVALIMVDEQGENMISVASGANLDLLPADVDGVPDEVFRAAKVFLACLESPLETVARGLARAKAAGLLTMLNPAPLISAHDVRGLLSLVDVLTPNEGELRALNRDGGRDAKRFEPRFDGPTSADDGLPPRGRHTRLARLSCG